MQSQCYCSLISQPLRTNSNDIAHRLSIKGFQEVLDLKKKVETVRLKRGDLGHKKRYFLGHKKNRLHLLHSKYKQLVYVFLLSVSTAIWLKEEPLCG